MRFLRDWLELQLPANGGSLGRHGEEVSYGANGEAGAAAWSAATDAVKRS